MLLARRLFRATSARTVELAGTNQFKMFATVNTKKNSLGNKDQVISGVVFSSRAAGTRAPGPGLKQQASIKLVNACIDQSEPQAPSSKLQATSLT